jgi:AcrR family transcriptional regulator
MESKIPLFSDKPDETKTAILKATFDALVEHGYADLTIDRIGHHFSKSEGVVFYHYDEKDEILLDLLDYLLERFVQIGVPISNDGCPETQLRTLLNQVISRASGQQARDYEIVLTELRMRAAQDEEFRELIDKSQDIFRNKVKEITRNGIESGDFREADPDLVADFLTTLVSGEIFEQVTSSTSRSIQSEVDNYIEYRLLAEQNSAP